MCVKLKPHTTLQKINLSHIHKTLHFSLMYFLMELATNKAGRLCSAQTSFKVNCKLLIYQYLVEKSILCEQFRTFAGPLNSRVAE
jgi:hypothetical protein